MESEESVLEDALLIKPIGKDAIHRICSGQVVLSLAIAVKELIENSIDAGATNIEVRLKEYGSELIEVIDNGSGVPKQNFSALTLKHYTSKLKDFHELETIATLGFRGEALSSLCALSNLTITTRHSSADYATKIIYDHNGHIEKESPTARPIGTTVTLENLFATLPVRKREFSKNLKREFTKMCQLLYAYCLVSKGIKFTCTNQTNKGAKNTVVSTPGLNKIKDNIISIFGAKQISCLIEVEAISPTEEIANEYNFKLAENEGDFFKFDCFISSAMHGSGRSTSDRQFYFINSRPCEPNKVQKLVNEIYRQYNGNQYPFVYLNIHVKTSIVDVNVTPDKRQIFLEKETLLLATVKSTLQNAFKDFPSTFKLQNLGLKSGESEDGKRGIKRSISDGNNTSKLGQSLLQKFKKRPRSQESLKTLSITELFGKKPRKQISEVDLSSDDELLDSFIEEASKFESSEDSSEADDSRSPPKTRNKTNKTVKTIVCRTKSKTKECIKDISTIFEESGIEVVELSQTADNYKEIVASRPKVALNCSMEAIKNRLAQKAKTVESRKELQVKFRSDITPKSNEAAERELEKQITKDMFSRMEIVGQFNLGFIIAKLDDDLFIIDQHATDEKYNFEQLQLSTVLESQNLINAKPLELTSAHEELLIDHEPIFNKNGFHFEIDLKAEATKKIKLTTIPMSKNYSFGKDDIDEMLFLLQNECNPNICRPSRVRGMFASRACRKSVMVGKSLNSSDMRKLVNHMGEIDQPWNCPHGRPTMRHLVNLTLLCKDLK